MSRYAVQVMNTVTAEVIIDAPNLEEAIKEGTITFQALLNTKAMPTLTEPGLRLWKARLGTPEAVKCAKVRDDYPEEIEQ